MRKHRVHPSELISPHKAEFSSEYVLSYVSDVGSYITGSISQDEVTGVSRCEWYMSRKSFRVHQEVQDA